MQIEHRPAGDLIKSIAYCGLICGACSNRCQPDCQDGGGCAPGECYHRSCCAERGLAGCWECDEFPCGRGFFASEEDADTHWITSNAYAGVCVGSVESIREHGLRGQVDLVLATLGDHIDYGREFRFVTVEGFAATLRGDRAADRD